MHGRSSCRCVGRVCLWSSSGVLPRAQVVWTGGARSILLWCAFTGAYLGALISKEVEAAPPPELGDPPAAAAGDERRFVVDPCKVACPCAHGMHAEGSFQVPGRREISPPWQET